MTSRIVVLHRARVDAIATEAAQLAGTCQRIAEQAEEVLKEGGTMHIQPQMAFVIGSLARLLKDWGVIEQLQNDGASQRRRIA